jgi:hypothetical protein
MTGEFVVVDAEGTDVHMNTGLKNRAHRLGDGLNLFLLG